VWKALTQFHGDSTSAPGGQATDWGGLLLRARPSTVVNIAAAVIAVTASTLQRPLSRFLAVGGVIGTTVSAGFLRASRSPRASIASRRPTCAASASSPTPRRPPPILADHAAEERYDSETHFTPRYRPWRQRIAFIPDGDFLEEVRAGKASVVTDEIERFTETGILLRSGKLLEAEIIITATGFNLNVLATSTSPLTANPSSSPTRSLIAA
jgi:cation diffusion facilitator CzcD-associated flavoprotein CzcO